MVAIDANVLRLHGMPEKRALFEVPPGEARKTVETWRALLDACVEAGLDRDSILVAVGGGVTLDLAGFAAAAYLRGIRWVAVPTTLLAQVDAAWGGKTGVDHPRGKNLIGAFHSPAALLVDPAYLATLSEREVCGGLAEVVKHGIIGDASLLDRAGRDAPASLVADAAAVKRAIVARDPFERGERTKLNLGHTLGHALERASDFALSHGEAVAVGLRAACRIAEGHCGFRDRARVEEALDRCGLPKRFAADPARLRDALRLDKKRASGRIRWILPVAVGDVRLFDDVPARLSDEALRETAGA
jgi:3-dehydroquinate synthetase